jgi:hypothetical protein
MAIRETVPTSPQETHIDSLADMGGNNKLEFLVKALEAQGKDVVKKRPAYPDRNLDLKETTTSENACTACSSDPSTPQKPLQEGVVVQKKKIRRASLPSPSFSEEAAGEGNRITQLLGCKACEGKHRAHTCGRQRVERELPWSYALLNNKLVVPPSQANIHRAKEGQGGAVSMTMMNHHQTRLTPRLCWPHDPSQDHFLFAPSFAPSSSRPPHHFYDSRLAEKARDREHGFHPFSPQRTKSLACDEPAASSAVEPPHRLRLYLHLLLLGLFNVTTKSNTKTISKITTTTTTCQLPTTNPPPTEALRPAPPMRHVVIFGEACSRNILIFAQCSTHHPCRIHRLYYRALYRHRHYLTSPTTMMCSTTPNLIHCRHDQHNHITSPAMYRPLYSTTHIRISKFHTRLLLLCAITTHTCWLDRQAHITNAQSWMSRRITHLQLTRPTLPGCNVRAHIDRTNTEQHRFAMEGLGANSDVLGALSNWGAIVHMRSSIIPIPL